MLRKSFNNDNVSRLIKCTNLQIQLILVTELVYLAHYSFLPPGIIEYDYEFFQDIQGLF